MSVDIQFCQDGRRGLMFDACIGRKSGKGHCNVDCARMGRRALVVGSLLGLRAVVPKKDHGQRMGERTNEKHTQIVGCRVGGRAIPAHKHRNLPRIPPVGKAHNRHRG